MTGTMVGTRPSVPAAMKRVWPKYTAKIVAVITGKSVRAGEEWVQGNKRGDWDALIGLMAASVEMEREVLAMVRAEREKTLDATTDGADGRMAAGEGRARGLDVARGARVPGHAPGRAGIARGPAELTARGRRA